MMILAPVAATLIQMAVCRSREYAADARDAAIADNPLWLASALRKLSAGRDSRPLQAVERNPATAHLFIVNPLRGRDLAQLFSTHPPVEERIRRLEAAARGSP